MKHKDYAIKLVKNYITICNSFNEDYVLETNIEDLKKQLFNNQWFIPKKCALKSCEELIDYINRMNKTHNIGLEVSQWLKVKEEIKKL